MCGGWFREWMEECVGGVWLSEFICFWVGRGGDMRTDRWMDEWPGGRLYMFVDGSSVGRLD
jgi:hypothetical protein